MEDITKQVTRNVEVEQDLIIDYSEKIFDLFLEEGVFKEIPVLKTVVALYKSGKSIKDYYAKKKLCAFLTGCQGIGSDEVRRFINSLEDEKTRENIGMQVLLIVDKVDDVKKAELIGRALKILIEGEIDFRFYTRLCHMIEKCLYSDILELENFTDTNTIITSTNKIMDSIVLESLFSSGLISNYGLDGGDFSGKNSGVRYGLNEYSIQLKRVL